MNKFKEIHESRDELKAQYQAQSYSKSDLEKMLKTGKVYIQYPEPRSRKKVGGGDIKSIKKDSVVIRDKFSGDDMEVKISDITMATKIK